MANLNYNKVILAGRLTKDPELKTTQSGHGVTSFTVAISSGSKDNENTVFINCTAWDKTAEMVTRFFRKASSIMVDGRLQTRTFEGQNGKQFVTEVVCERVYFVDSKSEAPARQAAPQVQQSAYIPEAYQQTANMTEYTGEEELPF